MKLVYAHIQSTGCMVAFNIDMIATITSVACNHPVLVTINCGEEYIIKESFDEFIDLINKAQCDIIGYNVKCDKHTCLDASCPNRVINT